MHNGYNNNDLYRMLTNHEFFDKLNISHYPSNFPEVPNHPKSDFSAEELVFVLFHPNKYGLVIVKIGFSWYRSNLLKEIINSSYSLHHNPSTHHNEHPKAGNKKVPDRCFPSAKNSR